MDSPSEIEAAGEIAGAVEKAYTGSYATSLTRRASIKNRDIRRSMSIRRNQSAGKNETAGRKPSIGTTGLAHGVSERDDESNGRSQTGKAERMLGMERGERMGEMKRVVGDMEREDLVPRCERRKLLWI
jgi:hypothetical protein